MDIHLITLDVGNTRLGIGVFRGGELVYSRRVPHLQREDWAGMIGEAWRHFDKAQQAEAEVAGCCVDPMLLEGVEYAAKKATGKRVQWCGQSVDLPGNVKTAEPGKTGVDRVLVMSAAYEQMGKACCVVDAGTAVTVDVCDDEGNFLGGAIAPGIAMQLVALEQAAAQLPDVEFKVPDGPIGTDTEEAIRHGAFHSIRGLVQQCSENYAVQLGNWPDIIATGGDAKMLFEGWELIHAVSPDLLHYGIAHAYAEHHIKHGT
ncbi:MAG: type III pantothenate kinase [Planctomycetota bacterium]